MLVHFPQAFSVSVLVLACAPLIFRGKAAELLFATSKVLALALPAAAAAALGAGVFDGRTRFKTIRRSPILKRKLVLAALLFLSSLGVALALWLEARPDSVDLPLILLAFVAFFSSLFLGILGNKITASEMPGD